MARYIIGSGELCKTAAKISPFKVNMSLEEQIEKAIQDPSFREDFARSVAAKSEETDRRLKGLETSRSENAGLIRNGRTYEQLLAKNNLRDRVDLQSALDEGKQLAGTRDRWATNYAGGDKNRLEAMLREHGQLTREKEILGKEKETLAKKLEDALEKIKLQEEQARMSKAVDSGAIKKIFTPKRLAIGGGAALVGGAGLYGLSRLARNKGDYEFLNN